MHRLPSAMFERSVSSSDLARQRVWLLYSSVWLTYGVQLRAPEDAEADDEARQLQHLVSRPARRMAGWVPESRAAGSGVQELLHRAVLDANCIRGRTGNGTGRARLRGFQSAFRSKA